MQTKEKSRTYGIDCQQRNNRLSKESVSDEKGRGSLELNHCDR